MSLPPNPTTDPLESAIGPDLDTAVVTGASSGIGLAIAQAFVAKNMQVIGLDRRQNQGAGFEVLPCDVTDADSVARAAERAEAHLGHIGVLVNSAGVVRLAPAEDLTLTDWQATLDVNLTGTFLACQEIGRRMISTGGGRIINLASQAASVAINEHLAYCASKFAVRGLTKVLALEWGKHRITVNSISPTVVLTELGRAAWAGPKGDAHKAEIPIGRFAQPEEVAAAVLFLASSDAAMINGADLLIDGGFTIR